MPRPDAGKRPMGGTGVKKTLSSWLEQMKERNRLRDEERARLINENAAETSNAIIRTLETIDFEHSRLPQEILEKRNKPEQPCGNLEYAVKYLIQTLTDEVRVFNVDLRPLDERLVSLAQQLKEAVEQGYEYAAAQAISGLGIGIDEIRRMVPQSGQVDLNEYVEVNAKYLEEWGMLVTHAVTIDHATADRIRQQKKVEADIAHAEEERDALYQNLMNKPEYQAAYQNLQKYDRDRLKWSPFEQKLHVQLVDSALKKTIADLDMKLLTLKDTDLSIKRQQLNTLLTKLNTIPDVTDPHLIEKWKKSVNELFDEMAKQDTEIGEMITFFDEMDGRIKQMESMRGSMAAVNTARDRFDEMIEDKRRQQQEQIEAAGGGMSIHDIGLLTPEEEERLKEARQKERERQANSVRAEQRSAQRIYES